MTPLIIEQHHRVPAAPRFMLRAVRAARGLSDEHPFPRLVASWTGMRIEPADVQAFSRATAMDAHGAVPVLFPHVCGFRLQMCVLTHRVFPLPIWWALQVRNRLVRHRHVEAGESFDLETQLAGHRFVEKGVEVELHTRLMRASDCYWESRITYFYRGRFGERAAPAPPAPAPALTDAAVVDRFQVPAGGGWAFGRLTGDYNGIHLWRWYARRFGFASAFLHPQRVAGMCLARLRGPDTEEQGLDLWIKGPVFYDSRVQLSAAGDERGTRFGLSLEGDARAALAGIWRPGADSIESIS